MKGRAMRIERHIGNQIRLLRTLGGVSLEVLAEAIGITPDRLDEIEGGWERATPELLVNLSEKFDVAPSFFFQLAPATVQALRS